MRCMLTDSPFITAISLISLGFMVYGLWFMVYGLWFGVWWGLEFRVIHHRSLAHDEWNIGPYTLTLNTQYTHTHAHTHRPGHIRLHSIPPPPLPPPPPSPPPHRQSTLQAYAGHAAHTPALGAQQRRSTLARHRPRSHARPPHEPWVPARCRRFWPSVCVRERERGCDCVCTF
jgi:hypothetical protein